MLKTFKFGKKACHELNRATVLKRLFLSEAYKCEEAWNHRLNSPLLQKIKPRDMYLDLEQKFSVVGKVSAVDVDIFANVVRDESQVSELVSMLKNLRSTPETTYTLDSTQHAVIKYLLGLNCTTDLFDVLNDRLNYGIFPDHVSYNILMDTFIKKGDFASAARVAILPMLQEDAEHPITNALSIYSCHKYLERPDDWKKPEPPEDTEEEIKVRVKYLRNPYFDDHFDLTDPRELVGKTLSFQGKHMKNTLGRTCQLRGLILHKKYNEVKNIIQHWLETIKNDIVYEEVLHLINQDNAHISDEGLTKELEGLQNKLQALHTNPGTLCKQSLEEAIQNLINSAINEQEEKDISAQCQRYVDWENKRVSLLNEQRTEIEKQKKLAELEEMQRELAERERLLTFFEHEEQIELKIAEKQMLEEKETKRVESIPKSAKKLRKLIEEEAYTPPEVR